MTLEMLPGEVSEGAGAQALEAAKEAYFALYTAENLQALIDRAREEAAVYSYPEYDQTQVNQLNAVIEQATEALAAEVNVRAAVYKSLEASIANLVNSKKINWQTIPTNEENPFSLNAGVFSKWQMEGGGNIGYAYAEGSVLYYVNVTEADTYDMTLNVSTPGTGAQLRITVTNEDDSELFNQVLDVPNTGGWGNKEDIKTTMTLPEGRVKLLIYGEQAGDNNFVCNTHVISFTKADPTGIDDVQRSMNDAPAIYDLLGRKVNAVKKGLYIINGKKVIVK